MYKYFSAKVMFGVVVVVVVVDERVVNKHIEYLLELYIWQTQITIVRCHSGVI